MLGHKVSIVFLICCLVITGCAKAQPTQAASVAPTEQIIPTAVPSPTILPLQVDQTKLSKELHLYNWDSYVDDSILSDFEKEYGVKVIIHTFDSNEEMLATLSEGNPGYDITVPQDYAVEIMTQKKMLAPLEKSLIPNIGYINSDDLSPYYDEGNVYSVPYLSGITGFVYNKKEFSTPPDSWGALFNVDQLEKYKGKVSMMDSERETIGAALLYLGKSPNDADPEDLAQVEKLLKQQQPYLKAYDDASTYTAEWLNHGEVVIAHAPSGTAIDAKDAAKRDNSNVEFGFVVPKEGGIIWQDNLVILADAPNPYTAHVFINFLLNPEMAARNMDAFNYLTPIPEAEKYLSPDLQAIFQDVYGQDSDLFKRLNFLTSENQDVFHQLWVEVRGEQ